MQPRPPLHEIANRTGLSVATVSRVLNHSPDTSDDARRKVAAALRETGHTMPAPAVGIIVRDLLNPYFAEIASGLQTQLVTADHLPVVVSTDLPLDEFSDEAEIDSESEFERNAPAFLQGLRVVGLVHLGVDHLDDEAVNQLATSGVPSVFFAKAPLVGNADYVFVDSRAGFAEALQYVHACGHERVAYLSGLRQTDTAEERLKAYEQAVSGQRFSASTVLEGDYTLAAGRRAIEQIVQMPASERPTALLAANDQMAIGAVQGAHLAHLTLPDDLSIIGYDNTSLCEMTFSTLASIAPKDDVASRIVNLLLKRVAASGRDGSEPLPAAEHVIGTRLEFLGRGSVARAGGGAT